VVLRLPILYTYDFLGVALPPEKEPLFEDEGSQDDLATEEDSKDEAESHSANATNGVTQDNEEVTENPPAKKVKLHVDAETSQE